MRSNRHQITVRLAAADDRVGWREAARRLDQAEIDPADVAWLVDDVQSDLFSGRPGEPSATPVAVNDKARADVQQPGRATASSALQHGRRVPRAFIELTDAMLLHSDTGRFDLAYRLLVRLRREPALLAVAADPDVARALRLAKAVRRDQHKMKAFVRFRKVTEPTTGSDVFIAWFEPEHHIIAATAPFFAGRFSNQRWSILSPQCSMHWDTKCLQRSCGAQRSDWPTQDAMETAWRTYFASIFNPARLNERAMAAEMPRKYWRNLPEAADIPQLVATAPGRVASMIDPVTEKPAGA
ncbi:MAG: TIGR03915 family putative DNA repair protein [Hyphomicrobiaceae bacterium]|nr:TIGR03915 family putative DNA repair protein [Hyphomicrobiaceae bacterium]